MAPSSGCPVLTELFQVVQLMEVTLPPRSPSSSVSLFLKIIFSELSIIIILSLSAGRAYYEGSWVIGKVHQTHRVLYVPFAGRESALSDYEVLVIRY